MSKILTIFVVLLWSMNSFAECNPKSKDVVIYIGFHPSVEELRGVDSACELGKRVITIPSEDYFKQYSIQYQPIYQWRERADALETQIDKECVSQNTPSRAQRCKALSAQNLDAVTKMGNAQTNFSRWVDSHPRPDSDPQTDLKDDLDKLKISGSSVDSLIISGHDGGGGFWGDFGRLSKEQVFGLANAYPAQFKNTSSIILMGCWTSVSNEVEQWKVNLPSLKVVAGFGGSAPGAEQPAGGDYIAGILKNTPHFRGASEQSVMQMLKSIPDINQITAAVYVDTSKACQDSVETPAYYALFAQNENFRETNSLYKPGMNKFTVEEGEALRLSCGAFNQNYSEVWQPVGSYFDGDREPSDTPDLQAAYNQIRQHEKCYTQGMVYGRYTPDQVLMLRHFQDVKKNFNLYFGQQISDAYKELDNYVANNKKNVPGYVQNQIQSPTSRLSGNNLIGMTRAQTLAAIRNLTGIRDDLSYSDAQLPKLNQLINLANAYLYQLSCLDGTWAEYDPNQTLAPPKCGPGVNLTTANTNQ